MNCHVHIIGIGSPFGDDRFGWAAAEALRQIAAVNAAPAGLIEISILDRPGPLLLTHWQNMDCVILLDAVRSGAAPGTWHRLDAHDLAGTGAQWSSHGFGIASAIELARVLGNMPSRLLLRGMEADSVWTGHSLSPAVAAALPFFVAEIAREALVLADSAAPAAANWD
ncbi:MAG: hydrogenase maturation protease [Sulfuricaulis sp.]|uniref:hydrogenase maturation protease n=1 Tax=Sulfuricaulis sp. TaxID=2003553 RepID=UPI0025E1D012|nr:hydrogenase maturation protease [Sulfuricaulis sp.]MCR4347125.1 hydrogenase maturation protease [Sulfuricaulis sp.]